HGAAPHRPRLAQLRALLLLGRRQGEARLGRAHHPAAAPAHLRQGGGQRGGGRRPQPPRDLERGAVAGEPGRGPGPAARPRAAAGAGRMSDLPHLPVMLAEIVEALAPRPGAWVVDGTFGAGGHSRAFLERGANVLAIDQDPGAAEYAAALAAEGHPGEVRFVAGNFREMERLAASAGVERADGVLLDLGV